MQWVLAAPTVHTEVFYVRHIQNLNNLASENAFVDDDDNGKCHCSGIFWSISTQTSTTLCAIG
jgi:hypothetical protein